ncbi:MAG: hypothetical protein ACOY4O_12845 [Pseudomonadota bacterium]
MLIRKGLLSTSGRAVALATVAAFALTAFEVPKVQAAEIRTAPVAKTAALQDDVTDFSARRRHYRGGGAAAGLAAFGLIAGTIAAAAAASNHRDHYYYPAPGYGYYGGGPVYYDAPAYYAPSYGYYGGGYSNSRAYRYEYGGN